MSQTYSPKILIAGFGSAGRRHFRNLAELGVDQIAFYRTLRSTLDASEIAPRPVFTDLQQALAWRPDGVVITTPTSLHMSVALAAARAGADLFIEKPVSHSRAGCDELCRLTRERRLVTMVGSQYRFHPLLCALRARLISGELGQPLSARAEYADSILLWHPWEDYRASYAARPELGGGAILTLVHPIDYLCWLFGPVAHVRATARKADYLETTVCDDIADLALEFRNGVIGHVHLDFVQDPPVHTLTTVCERGRAELDFLAGILRWYPRGSDAPLIERVPAGHDRNTLFRDEMTHFLGCMATRQETIAPLGDGLSVLDIALNARDDASAARD